MKYFLGALATIGIVLVFLFSPIKIFGKKKEEYLRIHIRANSNLECDQNVKYKVKDAVVDALIPLVAEIDDFDEAKKVMSENFDLIERVACEVLIENGFYYGAHAEINNEFFPTRVYDELVLEEGYYDALILNLGSGQGNNWWCIVYPAFCFTNSQNSDNIVYISKIWRKLKLYWRKQ